MTVTNYLLMFDDHNDRMSQTRDSKRLSEFRDWLGKVWMLNLFLLRTVPSLPSSFSGSIISNRSPTTPPGEGSVRSRRKVKTETFLFFFPSLRSGNEAHFVLVLKLPKWRKELMLEKETRRLEYLIISCCQAPPPPPSCWSSGLTSQTPGATPASPRWGTPPGSTCTWSGVSSSAWRSPSLIGRFQAATRRSGWPTGEERVAGTSLVQRWWFISCFTQTCLNCCISTTPAETDVLYLYLILCQA